MSFSPILLLALLKSILTHLQRLGNLVEDGRGHGLVNLCRLLKVVGNKVPGVGDGAAPLLARLHQLARQLLQRPGQQQNVGMVLWYRSICTGQKLVPCN